MRDGKLKLFSRTNCMRGSGLRICTFNNLSFINILDGSTYRANIWGCHVPFLRDFKSVLVHAIPHRRRLSSQLDVA